MYRIVEITGVQGTRKFLKFPGDHIFINSQHWVPPLLSEEIKRFDPSHNDFYSYGCSRLFAVVDENGKWLGRIASFINSQYIDKYGKNQGFFGFFDAVNDVDVSRLLFTTVANELEKNNITEILGPVNFSFNEEAGLLTQGFDISPSFMTNYSMPYYRELLEKTGLQRSLNLYAFEWTPGHTFPPHFYRIVQTIKGRETIRIRCFDKNKFQEELEKLWPVYNESFADVTGFTPISRAGFFELGNSFRLFADFDLILIAEVNGKVAGFCLALPDINILIKKISGKLLPFGIITLLTQKSRIRNLRLNVLAVLPAFRKLGVAALLIDRVAETSSEKKYLKCELSVVLDSNIEMMRLLNTLNFKPVKTYGIYHALTTQLKQPAK